MGRIDSIAMFSPDKPTVTKRKVKIDILKIKLIAIVLVYIIKWFNLVPFKRLINATAVGFKGG